MYSIEQIIEVAAVGSGRKYRLGHGADWLVEYLVPAPIEP